MTRQLPRIQRAHRLSWAASAGAAALACGLLAALPSQAAEPADPAEVSDSGDIGFGPATDLTLVSGDRLQVRESADGKLVVTSADRDSTVRLAQFTDAAGDLHVVPAELLPLIPERLDPRLFNVSALLRDGYGSRTGVGSSTAAGATSAGRGMPLIVTYTGEPVSVAGLAVQRELPSVGGAAVTLTATDAFRAALDASTAAGFLSGVEKIWLDAPVRAALDESVPQIGAPAAWAEGIDGAGVTIAVVDTGIDDSHADLAGRVVASELFAEGTDTADDLNGHGTHVASTAAGDGAASGGQFSGVAFAASLVNAKVLDDFGSGLESWVLAGMEWSAIEQDADIVNMSLTGGPSDGTDLISQAVDTLSAEEDALFVTAAGNFGGAPGTLETPATADSALAVGAVDKSDVLAYFSAWGPRLDGTGVKPEIVAPGVDITAARAAGSELGPPVGEDYMELSGTSMAAPHVAGAAALLLQANPDWTWSELKSALVTSATDVGGTSFQQGGGRVDVAAALDQVVHSDVATIDLGALEYPHDDGESVTADVTLTNAGDAEVELALAVDAVNDEGDDGAGMLALSTPELVIGAGDSEVVQVTFDPSTGPIGLFGGSLTATTGGDEALHVPLSFQKEPELADLDVNLVLRDAALGMFGMLVVQNVDDPTRYFETFDVFGLDQTISTRVPLGAYNVSWLSFQDQASGALDVVAVTEPQVDIAAGTDVSLDANGANEITVDAGTPTTTDEVTVGLYRRGASHDRFGFQSTFSASGTELHAFVNETDPPVTVGDFEFFSYWLLSDGPDHRYDLIFPEPEQVPADVTYTVAHDDLATISNAFHADVDRTNLSGRAYFRPYSSFAFVGLYQFAVPATRTDHITADDTRWLQLVDVGDDASVASIDGDITTYEPGVELHESWAESPSRPARTTLTRTGDLLSVFIPPWTDQDNHVGYEAFAWEGESYDAVHLMLSADGTLVGEADASFADFAVPAGAASYELSMHASRTVDWWRHSTSTSTTWWFTSESAGDEPEKVKLPLIGYDIDLDLYNETNAPNLITFSSANVRGAPEVSDLTAAWSIDDGVTWQPLDLARNGRGDYDALVPVPSTCDPSCFVSLQVAATGTAGPLLQQEVIRAYTAHYAAPPTSPPPTSPPPTTPPPTTSPTPPDPTVTPTATLPGTGAGNAASLAGLGLGLFLLGGIAVVVARRRLTSGD